MAPELDNVEIGPWFGALVFGDRSKFNYATGASKCSNKPVVVGMALACHIEGTGGQTIGQMHLPVGYNGRNNKGGRCEVDYSPTMVLEIQVRDSDNFHNSTKLPKEDVGDKMVLEMDFSQAKLCSGKHMNRPRWHVANRAIQ